MYMNMNAKAERSKPMAMRWCRMLLRKGGHPSVEDEVRRRLTWRMRLLAFSPVPLLLVLLLFLYCFMQSNRASIRSLQRQNRTLGERLRLVERRLAGDNGGELMLFVVRRRDGGLEYSFRRGALDGLLEGLQKQREGVVDFDMIYPDDFAGLRKSPTLGFTLLEIPVASLPCPDEGEGDRVQPSVPANEAGRVFGYVIVRSRYRFRPLSAPHRGVVTVFELLCNATQAQAKACADEAGRVREEMNYFSDEFDFEGTTVYDGVCSLVGFDAPDLDGVSVLDSSSADGQVLMIMSKRELKTACTLVRQVDERRRFLAKCRRKCGDAERKEGLA